MTDTAAEANSSLSEAEQFLKTLDLPNDNETNADANGTNGQAAANASDIMSFLDEITNTTNHYEASETDNSQKEPAPIFSDSWRQWGTSIWNQANEVVKTTSEHINQATSNPDTAAKALQERVGGWQAFISSNNVAKLGEYGMDFLKRKNENQYEMIPRAEQSLLYICLTGNSLKTLTTASLNTILDNVAPPISEHEVVEIWISHDIAGYIGLEPLVFQSFSKMMEQTDGGDVVIRKGRSTGQRDGEYGAWDMNFCDDVVQAQKLCKVMKGKGIAAQSTHVLLGGGFSCDLVLTCLM